MALGLLMPATGLATPKVATDIGPVHGLVSMVMKGVGTPDQILPPGASPHGYAMRPSEAAALSDADVIFWIGEGLTPWFGRAIGNLAPDAVSVEMAEAKGVALLSFREGATFEAHAHDDDDDHAHGEKHAHDDHGHKDHDHDDHAKDEDHDDHAHGEKHAHDDHGHKDHDHDDHAHGEGSDPHVWLDPLNAIAFLETIEETLSKADPDNASAYHANAKAAKSEIRAAMADVEGRIAGIKGRGFVVFHDAYHYFEHRFGIEAAGAISIGDASSPSPARVREIQDLLKDTNAACVFAEPQFEPKLIAVVTEGTKVRSGTLDPLGTDLQPGAGFYPALITSLAGSLADCLSHEG